MFSLALLLINLEEVEQRAPVLDAIRDEIQYEIETTFA
jgi:hypothetical protein